MKKFLISVAFALFFLFFVFGVANVFAQICTPPATCRPGLTTCPTGNSTGACTATLGKGSSAGICCISQSTSGGPGSTNSFSWGSWGNAPAGTSLQDFKNLLGAGSPKNASKATWENVLSTFISLIFLAAIIVALAFLILGGYNWTFSGGDKQKLAKARQHVTFAIIGLIIVFISIFIISVIGSFFGINFLNLP